MFVVAIDDDGEHRIFLARTLEVVDDRVFLSTATANFDFPVSAIEEVMFVKRPESVVPAPPPLDNRDQALL